MTATTTAPAARESRSRELLVDAFSGTPGRMRILGGCSVAACVLFGVLAFGIGVHLHSQLNQARAHAQQLVRVQAIRTNLVQADANATNAFLVAGLEGPAVRAGYTDGIAAASATIAQAASAEPSDAKQLAKVNEVLSTYTGMIEAARANNRQGFPIGAAYLRAASNSIRSDALPPLQQLVDEQRQGFDNASNAATTATVELVILLVLAILVLAITQVWLYLRTRRVFNRALVVATLLVLVGGVIGIAFFGFANNKVDDARAGPYAETVALATARIDGFDAKSDESLTLIARGSGGAYEDAFKGLATSVHNALNTGGTGAGPATSDSLITFDAYVSAHQAVRALDDKGNHDAAVKAATDNGAANAAFQKFETASNTALTQTAAKLSSALHNAARWLVPVSWLMLLAGIAAALAARRGIAERLREYR